jgi:hypothetical protein
MPFLYDDATDQPTVTDAQTGFERGMISNFPPSAIPAEACSLLVNVDIAKGTGTTRRGVEQLSGAAVAANRIQGLKWYSDGTTDRLIAVCNGATYSWDGSAWASWTGYTPTGTSDQVCMASFLGRTYFVDGTQQMRNWDGTTLTGMGTGATNPPVGASIVINAAGRLWASGVAALSDALYASVPGTPATWDNALLMIQVGSGDGDPIRGLAALDDFSVLVLKRNSTWIVRADPITTSGSGAGTSLANANVRLMSARIGCVSHRSIAAVGNDIWWLSDNGVYSLRRIIGNDQREISEDISDPIHDLIDRINKTHFAKCAGFFWNNRYMISVPIDSSTEPNYVLAYDTRRQAWAGYWTGWTPLIWEMTRFSGNQRLVFGRTDGKVWQWLDYVQDNSVVTATYQDAGTDIPTTITTHSLVFGELTTKKPVHLAADFLLNNTTLDVDIVRDIDTTEEVVSGLVLDFGRVSFPITFPVTFPTLSSARKSWSLIDKQKAREFQVKFTTTAGKLSIRDAWMTAFVNPIEINE